jgi:hypothetical protein
MGNYSSINQAIDKKRKLYQKNQLKLEEKYIILYDKFISNYSEYMKKLTKKFYKNYKNDIINKFIFSYENIISLKLPEITINKYDYKTIKINNIVFRTKIIKINIDNKICKYYDNLIYYDLFEKFNQSYKDEISYLINNMIILFYNYLFEYIKKDFIISNIIDQKILISLKTSNYNLLNYNFEIIYDNPPSYDDIYPEHTLMESRV